MTDTEDRQNSMTTFKKRLISGLGANGYGQIVTILSQVLSIPIFLSNWDLVLYGVWLTISAIPAYAALANLGIGTVAGSKMTILIGANAMVDANKVFQSALLFVNTVCLPATLLLALFVATPLSWLPSQDAQHALALLFAGVLVGQFGGLAESVFKATNRYATGTSFGVNARLVEWLGFLVGLYTFGSLTAVALGGLIGRSLVVVISVVIAVRGQIVFSWGIRQSSWREVRLMLKPSMGVLALTASSALTLQGLTLLAGYFLGPIAVVIFNTHRTLARLAVQTTSMLSHTLWPEFSKMFGQRKHISLRRLYRRSALIGNVASMALALALLLTSGIIFEIWTHGRVQVDLGLMSVFLVYSVVASALHIPRVLMVATNQHALLGVHFLAFAALALLLAWLLVGTYAADGLAASMVVGELACLIVTLMAVKRFFEAS